jgi:hypothetical protein
MCVFFGAVFFVCADLTVSYRISKGFVVSELILNCKRPGDIIQDTPETLNGF